MAQTEPDPCRCVGTWEQPADASLPRCTRCAAGAYFFRTPAGETSRLAGDSRAELILHYLACEVFEFQPEPERDENEIAIRDGWDELLDQIGDDCDRAADFDPQAGFLYRLPDGTSIEVTYQSAGAPDTAPVE